MTTPASPLKLIRQIHLYFGVFIAPALLFFAFTGAMQTFSLHETTRGSDYKPPAWAVTLAQLHKKQTVTVPIRKSAPAVEKVEKLKPGAASETSAKVAVPSAVPVPPAPRPKSHLPMKIFFLIVSIGLFTSTLTGIYMAYKYNRNKLVVSGLLLAGIAVPLALLPF